MKKVITMVKIKCCKCAGGRGAWLTRCYDHKKYCCTKNRKFIIERKFSKKELKEKERKRKSKRKEKHKTLVSKLKFW